jgi:deazaflavin-dependent oxidoreductase (nitroreductase family)
MIWDQRTPLRWISATHEFWYRLTNGLFGGNIFGSPILLLTVTGRKSGKRFTTPLLYLRDGDDIVVIASNNGSDRHPQWWLNLRAEPEATVQVMSQHHHVVAREATGDERARLWAEITRRYPVYLQYERRTKRTIPVVVLRTIGDASAAE